ncbi:MAG: Asp-tRNA(Asn)/Glu-tRNA(Gln) amidotransferase subunit GatB, partial [Dehalococcoidia bacterium]
PYPDLVKGYQISQYDQPLCVGGTLDIEVDGVAKRVQLERIHLEEDTARLLHRDDGAEPYSLLDVNRSGVPLMELVTTPDLRSGAETAAFLRKLRQTLRYLDISDADMEKGSFRFDVNISLRPHGQETLGTKVELKNMNSFRSAQRAVEFEVERQTAILDAGGRIVQETRGYVDATGETSSQRSKEEAHDYRYFPEPDLPPLRISREEVAALRAALPELPDAKRARFEADYGLTHDEAAMLAETRERADAFEESVRLAGPARTGKHGRARAVAHWFMGDVVRLLHAADGEVELGDSALTPGHIAELVRLVEEKTITANTAKEVLEAAFASGEMPSAIVEARGLRQVSDAGAIDEVARRVIEANPKAVDDYRGGKDSAIQFLVGQVMREMRGRANPQSATEALRAHLDGGR